MTDAELRGKLVLARVFERVLSRAIEEIVDVLEELLSRQEAKAARVETSRVEKSIMEKPAVEKPVYADLFYDLT